MTSYLLRRDFLFFFVLLVALPPRCVLLRLGGGGVSQVAGSDVDEDEDEDPDNAATRSAALAASRFRSCWHVDALWPLSAPQSVHCHWIGCGSSLTAALVAPDTCRLKWFCV